MVVMARTFRMVVMVRVAALRDRLRSVSRHCREFFRVANRGYTYKNHQWTQDRRDDYWSK
jgi:hypothetical protein